MKRGKRSAGETNNNRRIPPRPPSATPSQSASPTITSNSPRSRSLSTSNALDDAASARKKSSHRPIPPKSPAPVSPAAETITSLPRSLPRSNRDKYGSTSPSHPPPPPPPPRRRSQSLVNYSTSSNSDDLISSTSSSSELIKNGGDGSSYESGQARSRSLARSLPTKKSSKAAKATPSVTTAESTETDVLTEGGKSRLLINNHRTGRAGESDKFEGTNRSSSHDESRESQDGSKGKHDLDESAVKSRKERLRKMSSRAVENDSQSPERGRSREKKKKASAAKERKLAAASAEQLTEKEYAESAAIDSLFEHLDRKASDFDGNVLSIKVHSADSLRPNLNVLHPLVKIHIVGNEEIGRQMIIL